MFHLIKVQDNITSCLLLGIDGVIVTINKELFL